MNDLNQLQMFLCSGREHVLTPCIIIRLLLEGNSPLEIAAKIASNMQALTSPSVSCKLMQEIVFY